MLHLEVKFDLLSYANGVALGNLYTDSRWGQMTTISDTIQKALVTDCLRHREVQLMQRGTRLQSSIETTFQQGETHGKVFT